MRHPLVILGIDPALQHTGWGVIRVEGSHISHIDSGRISTKPVESMDARLLLLHQKLSDVIDQYQPNVAAIEETFVSGNAQTALALGQARGAILLTLALKAVTVHSYAATLIKKTIAGAGRADKEQVLRMVQLLLPAAKPTSSDAADALATALCHAQHRKFLALS
jgi:crossover junction endodeoxyribonuclease RuvC